MQHLTDVFTKQNYDVRHEYDELFQLLMAVKDAKVSSGWEAGFTNVIERYFTEFPVAIADFPVHQQYSRNYIGHEEGGSWQAMISRWEPGATSTIHGHPDFIFYYVLAGSFDMPFFERVSPDSDQVIPTHQMQLQTGQAISSIGIPGQFDNMIHQVIAPEPSLALHIFSDDALKGEVFKRK